MRISKGLIGIALLVVLAGCGKKAEITGRVVDNSGKGIDGVVVKIENTGFVTTTDKNGEYRIGYVPGKIDIVIKKQGYSVGELNLDIATESIFPAEDVTLTKIPSGGDWVLVPGNLSLGTSDFYVMKYEAKDIGGFATSQADATPWVNIDLPSAAAACAALNPTSHLLTIVEAQAINRNIEAQAANWGDGVIGSKVSAGGGLKRGNIGITDSASYNGADPEYGTGRNTKAKLVLSNGEELWDWSGNVGEWVYGAGADGILGTPGGVAFSNVSRAYEWKNPIVDLSQERPIIGPSNSGWSNAHGMGAYFTDVPTAAVFRGGAWNQGVDAGVFAFYAYYTPSNVHVTLGFRCGR